MPEVSEDVKRKQERGNHSCFDIIECSDPMCNIKHNGLISDSTIPNNKDELSVYMLVIMLHIGDYDEFIKYVESYYDGDCIMGINIDLLNIVLRTSSCDQHKSLINSCGLYTNPMLKDHIIKMAKIIKIEREKEEDVTC